MCGTPLAALFLLAQSAGVVAQNDTCDTLIAPYFDLDFSRRFFQETQSIKDSVQISGEYVFLSRIYKQVILDTTDIAPLSTYISARITESGRKWLVDKLLEENKDESQQNQGLIPDVEIPVSMPGNLAFLGEGGKLEIDGKNSITVGGRGDYPIGISRTELDQGTPFSLEMDQTMQVRLTGTVGTKIKVLIDHDSERMNQSQNKVSIKYEGEEDEVVQLLEAGDTKVDFPSTTYASFPGGSKTGLFGVKGVFKMGGLQATLLAARDRGSRESKQFTGDAQIVVDTIPADQFMTKKFYDLHIPAGYTLVSLLLFRDDNNPANDKKQNARYGIAYYEGDTNAYISKEGKFYQLREDQGDFTRFQFTDWIELSNSLSSGEKLAAYMILQAPDSSLVEVGDTSGDTLILKLIAPGDFVREIDPDTMTSPEQQEYLTLWNMEFKNVYYVSSTMSHTQPKITVFWDAGSEADNPVGIPGKGSFAYLLNLDPDQDGYLQEVTYIDTDGDGAPDTYWRMLDYRQGYLIFPDAMPFASDALKDDAMGIEPEEKIYYKIPLESSDEQKFFMVIEYTQKMDQIFLAPDIQEGSVVVKVNGVEVPSSAYSVDYNMGYLRILDDSYFSDPNAVIDISYDVIPAFSMTQRSLLGLRLDYEYSDNITMGSSMIMSSQTTSQIRPRLGEVPSRAAVVEMDMQGEFYYDWLTRGLDRLPLIATDEDSKLTLKAEAAQSFPNPNTMGEAYLDDMENIKDSRSLPVQRGDWKFGSVPPNKELSGLVSKQQWFNPRHRFTQGDIYPNLPPEEADDYEDNVLSVVLHPSSNDPDSNWISFNHLISRSGTDYSTMEFLEVYLGQTDPSAHLELHLDMGYDIPEDAPRRDALGNIRGVDTLDNEDADGNAVFDVGAEDTGLDGVFGNDDDWSPGDPDYGNDDYNAYDMDKVNGTENNSKWDNEDLDQNGGLNTQSNYYSWTIDLDTTTWVSSHTGGGVTWKYYKIPIRDSSRYTVFGNPSFDLIRYARLWIDGFDSSAAGDTLFIAKLDISGNQWFSQGTNVDTSGMPIRVNESFRTAYVNNKDDAAYYSPPPGARILETEPGKYEQEGSLALIYNELMPGHQGLAKRGLYQKHDLLEYQRLAFWVKPHPTTQSPYPTLIFRMGTDSNNYYEYRYQIQSSDWQEVSFSLDSLTRFKKLVKDTLSDSTAKGPFYEGNLGFKGNPNISQINFYWFGVLNQSEHKVSGEIWVDELRATNPHTEGGRAYRGQATLQVADIASFDISGTQEEANFQGLSDASRRNQTSKNATYTGSINAEKIFPKSWGMSIPLKFQGSSTYSLPKYSSGGDVLLTPEEALKQRSISGTESYSGSISKRGSANRLLKWFVDPVKLNASRSITHDFSYTSQSKTDGKSGTISYSYSPTIRNGPKIFGKQLRYLPNSYSLRYSVNDNYSYSMRSGIPETSYKTTGSYGGDISWTPISNISARYSLNKDLDYRAETLLNYQPPDTAPPIGDTSYVPPDTTNDFRFPWNNPLYAWESGHDENLSASYNISFMRNYIAPRVSYSASYNEDHAASNQSYNPVSGKLVDTRNANASTNTDITVSNRVLSSVFGLLAKGIPRDSANKGQQNLLEKLHRGLGNTTVGYSFSRNASFPGLYGRPDWRFRYGFSENPHMGTNQRIYYSITETNGFNLSQGLNLSALSVRSSWDLKYTRNQNMTSPSMSKSLTNPQINITLSNLNFMLPPEYQKQLTSASLSTGFSQRFQWNWPLHQDSLITDRSMETRFQPLVQLNLNLKSGTSITGSYDLSKQLSEQFGANRKMDNTQNNDISINISHTFQSFGGLKFPWAEGRVFKLESELRLNFKFTQSNSQTTTSSWEMEYDGLGNVIWQGYGEPEITAAQQTQSYGIDGTYKFSSSVTGTVSFTNDMSLNKMSNQGYKTMKLLFTVNFQF